MQTIISHHARLVVVNYAYTKDGTGCHKFQLIPGVNIITPEEWDAAKDDSDIKRMIKAGEIEIGPRVESVPSALKKLTAAAATELVTETNDPRMLDQWSSSEKRTGVQDAIVAQKTKLANVGKKLAQ